MNVCMYVCMYITLEFHIYDMKGVLQSWCKNLVS